MEEMIKKDSLIQIRDAVPGDMAFVLATWLRGLKFGNSWYKLINTEIYYDFYHKVLENLLLRPKVIIKIACLKEDPQIILGYSVYDDSKLHWVYVKKAWREIGIAKSLFPVNIKVITHLTEIGKAIFLKNKDWIFNPFFII